MRGKGGPEVHSSAALSGIALCLPHLPHRFDHSRSKKTFCTFACKGHTAISGVLSEGQSRMRMSTMEPIEKPNIL